MFRKCRYAGSACGAIGPYAPLFRVALTAPRDMLPYPGFRRESSWMCARPNQKGFCCPSGHFPLGSQKLLSVPQGQMCCRNFPLCPRNTLPGAPKRIRQDFLALPQEADNAWIRRGRLMKDPGFYRGRCTQRSSRWDSSAALISSWTRALCRKLPSFFSPPLTISSRKFWIRQP